MKTVVVAALGECVHVAGVGRSVCCAGRCKCFAPGIVMEFVMEGER